MFDVIIVGAGPAGSICAYMLAKNFKVALVEKAVFPRKKLCGGGLSYKAVNLLKDVIDLTKISGKSITGSYLCFKNQHLTYVGQDAASYSIERSEFDNELLSAAKRAGAEIIIPNEVKTVEENTSDVKVTLNDGKELRANFLVIAEGVNGKLFEQAGYSGRRELTFAMEVDAKPKSFPEQLKENTLFDFGAIPQGYAWIFPKEGYWNIGAYYYKSQSIDRSKVKALECFVKQFSWLKDAGISRVKGHALPRLIDYAAYNTARTLLIGDSAGTVENFYGEGLYYGLRSGQIAAEEITKAFYDNNSLDNYTRRLKSEILVHVKYSMRTAGILYPRQKLGYYKMVRSKLINNCYAGLINGKISHRKCFYLTAAFLPISIFTSKLKDRDFNEVGLVK